MVGLAQVPQMIAVLLAQDQYTLIEQPMVFYIAIMSHD